MTRDIHCVTSWSKLNTAWEGVIIDDILADAGRVIVSDLLDPTSRHLLGLEKPLCVHRLDDKHRAFLAWHREHVFRRTTGLPK